MSTQSMPATAASPFEVREVIRAFIAGAVAVFFFHQGMATILHAIDFGTVPVYPTQATKPFGVPKIWSWVFWGGVWGIVFNIVWTRLVKGKINQWIFAFVFGAIFPTMGVWFVVQPLNGAPVGGGFPLVGVIAALLVHGSWGVGAALLLNWSARNSN